MEGHSKSLGVVVNFDKVNPCVRADQQQVRLRGSLNLKNMSQFFKPFVQDYLSHFNVVVNAHSVEPAVVLSNYNSLFVYQAKRAHSRLAFQNFYLFEILFHVIYHKLSTPSANKNELGSCQYAFGLF
jgi:hypothetical protein